MDIHGPVWPPPPSTAPPQVPFDLDRFKPLVGLRLSMIVCLSATSLLLIIRDLTQGVILLGPVNAAPVFALDMLGSFAMSLVTAYLFLVWTYRAYRDLSAISTNAARTTPGWAIAFFFIPILCLYRPVEVFEELWCKSEPYPLPDAKRPPTFIGHWWTFFVLMNCTDNFAWRLPLSTTAAVPSFLVIGNIVLTIAASVHACKVIDQLTKRIHARYNGIVSALDVPQSWG